MPHCQIAASLWGLVGMCIAVCWWFAYVPGIHPSLLTHVQLWSVVILCRLYNACSIGRLHQDFTFICLLLGLSPLCLPFHVSLCSLAKGIERHSPVLHIFRMLCNHSATSIMHGSHLFVIQLYSLQRFTFVRVGAKNAHCVFSIGVSLNCITLLS